MAVQNLGRVGLVLKGDWSNATTYVKLDVVAYDGNSWVAKRSNTNVTPNTTNSDDWQLISNNADLVSTVQGYKNDAAASATDAAESAASAQSYSADALTNEATAFSTSVAYTAGQYVIYDNGSHKYLYRFTSDHAAGAWVGTDAVQVTFGKEVTSLKSALKAVDTRPLSINYAGTWISGGNAFIIPVKAGDEAQIVRNQNGYNAMYAFVDDPNIQLGSSIQYVSGYSLTAGSTANFAVTMPAGTNYLAIVGKRGDYDYTPANVYINGTPIFAADRCLYASNLQIASASNIPGFEDLKALPGGAMLAYTMAGAALVTSGDVPFSKGFFIVTLPDFVNNQVGSVQLAVSLLTGEAAWRTHTGSWGVWHYDTNTYYVGSSRTKDGRTFNTLKECTEFIRTNGIQNATVYCDKQVYDLVSEYGQSYLDGGTFTGAFGLGIGNNTHFVFTEGCVVQFHYSGNNSGVKQYFSPFNVYGSFTLENVTIDATNCRYCVHEDVPTYTNSLPDHYTAKYINCVMVHNGNDESFEDSRPVCIGAGTFRNSLSVIENGKYTCPGNDPWAISYHNFSASNYGDYPSRVVIKNAWMSNGVRLGDFSTSDVDVEISGCYMPSGRTQGVTHFNVTEWNNGTYVNGSTDISR